MAKVGKAKVLGCNVYEHSHNLCSSNIETGYVATAIAGYSRKSTRICQLLAKQSDTHCNLGSTTKCIDSKTPSRNASRKKTRNKISQVRKFADKIFAEELLVEACKCDESASSHNSSGETIHHEAMSSVDGNQLSKMTVPSSEPSPECSCSGMYDIKKNYSECNVCNCKPTASAKCEFVASECFNGKNREAAVRCASLRNVKVVKPNSGAFLSSGVKKYRSHFHNTRKNDHSRLTWKKCQVGRITKSEKAELSLPDHVNFESSLQTSSCPGMPEAFHNDELLIMPSTSTQQNIAAHGTNTSDNDADLLCKGICIDLSVESSSNVAQPTVSCESCPSVSQAKQLGSVDLNNSDENLTDFGESRSNSWTTKSCGLKPDRCQYRSVSSQTELLQKQFPCGAKFNLSDRCACAAVQPCVWMKLPRMTPSGDDTPDRFGGGEWRNLSCSDSNISSRIWHGQDITQQPSSRKWIPVCKNQTKSNQTYSVNPATVCKSKVKIPGNTVSVQTCDDNNLSLGGNDFSLEGNLIPLCATDMSSGGLGSRATLSTHKITSLFEHVADIEGQNSVIEAQKVQLSKDYHKTFDEQEGFQHLINAELVQQAFSASYRLQVASETVQQATSHPIADFERLLCSATPFIASSFSCNLCADCLPNQPCSPPFCRDWVPNFSLQTIWNWYEEPGNYGLKVNVDDAPNQKGCFADTVSFQAHFVPLLSAIQLFGYQHLSSSCSSSPVNNLKTCGKEVKFQASELGNPMLASIKASLMGSTVVNTANLQAVHDASNLNLVDRNKPPNVGNALPNDADLIFEFFESEQPQRRMPLHSKIIDLARKTSNNNVFGDPSKLECMNLNDLHPASWFSVAWYPVYRIPEGKLCAAFLTYHSLGYLVERCMGNDSLDKDTLGLVLPVIGLQSYNAQDELWFSPYPEVESSFRELTPVLLKERLGILQENALLFARGMVSRDHTTISNRQPDYEFFMSRKH